MSINAQADVAVADEEVVADEQPGATPAAAPEDRPNKPGSRGTAGRPAMPAARAQPESETQAGPPERRVASLPPADTPRFDGPPVLPPAATLSPELGDGSGGEDAPEHDEPPRKEERDKEARGEPNDEARGEPREPPQLPVDAGALIQPITQALAQAALPLATMAPLLAGLGSNGDLAPSAGETGFDRDFGRGADGFRDGDGFASDDVDDFDADMDQGVGGYGPIPATVEGVGRFVRQVLEDFGFGTPNGYETRGLGGLASGMSALGATFEGATSEAFRVVARLMGADEETIDDLTGQLQNVFNPYAESHVGNRRTLAGTYDVYRNEIRHALRFPEVERTSLNARSMQYAVRGTEWVLYDKALSNAQAVRSVDSLTKKLPLPRHIGDPPAHLSRNSSPREVAARIIWEARRRGYSREQTIAILATAIQESSLRQATKGDGGRSHGIFQQDASYPGRGDPNRNVAGFFDRLEEKGGPQSPDIWKSINWLQQRPSDPSAEVAYARARPGYMTEIQSRVPAATKRYNILTL